jgi:chromosome segregation ATPase
MNVQPLKTFCLAAALAMCMVSAAYASPGMSDPAQIQTEAFIQLLQADQALDAGRLEEALSLYTSARDYYQRVATEFPEYDPRVIQYRHDYCEGQIDEVMADLGMAPREAEPVELPGVPAAPEADPEPVAVAVAEAEVPADGAASETSVAETLRANLAAALAERDSIRDAMSAQGAARKAEVESLRARIAELEAAVAAAPAAAEVEPDAAAAKAAEKAARDLEKARQDKADLKKKLKEAEKEAEKAAAGFGQRIAELESALEARDSELAAKDEEYSAKVSELTAQLEAAASVPAVPVPPAESAAEAPTVSAEDVGELASVREQLAVKEMKLAELSAASEKLTKDAEKATRDLEKVREEKSDLKKLLKAAEKKVAEFEKQLASQGAAADADRAAAMRPLEERVDELQYTLEAKESELAALQADREALAVHVAELEAVAAAVVPVVPAEAQESNFPDDLVPSAELDAVRAELAAAQEQLAAKDAALAVQSSAADADRAAAIRPLEERVDELQYALEAKDSEIATLQADRDAFATRTAELEAVVASAQAVAGQAATGEVPMVAASELSAAQELIAAKDAALAEAAEAASKLEKDAEKTSRDLKDVRAERSELKKQLKSIEAEHATAMRPLEERVDELQYALDEKESELAARAEELAARSAEAESLSARVAELESALAAATAEDTARQIASLREQAAAAESELAAVRAARDEAAGQVTAAAERQAELEGLLSELTADSAVRQEADAQKIGELSEAMAAAEARADGLQAQLDETAARLAEATADDLAQQLENLRARQAESELALEAERANRAALDGQLADATARAEDLESRMRSLIAENLAQLETLSRTTEELAGEKAALAAKGDEVQRLQEQLRNRDEDLAGYQPLLEQRTALVARQGEIIQQNRALELERDALSAQLVEAQLRAARAEAGLRDLIANARDGAVAVAAAVVAPTASAESAAATAIAADGEPEDALARARALLLAGEADAALDAVRSISGNGGIPAILLQGTALTRLQRYSEAIETLAPAVQANGRHAELQAAYGAALMGARRYDEARAALARAVSLDRECPPETYANLAMLCAFMDPVDLKLARRYYEQAREAGLPSSPQLEKRLK